MKDLQVVIDKEVNTIKENQLTKLMEEMQSSFASAVIKPLQKILDDPNDQMWSKIRQMYVTAKQKIAEKLQERLQGF